MIVSHIRVRPEGYMPVAEEERTRSHDKKRLGMTQDVFDSLEEAPSGISGSKPGLGHENIHVKLCRPYAWDAHKVYPRNAGYIIPIRSWVRFPNMFSRASLAAALSLLSTGNPAVVDANDSYLKLHSDTDYPDLSPYLTGVNGGPWKGKEGVDFVSHAADIKGVFQGQYVRPHDVENQRLRQGCDMHIVYPDSTADPADSASYNFGKCDDIMDLIEDNGLTPYLRIGVSYASNVGAGTLPPSNIYNYAKAAAKLINRYKARFVEPRMQIELWNEPFNGNGKFWPTRQRDEFAPMIVEMVKEIKTSVNGRLGGGLKVPSGGKSPKMPTHYPVGCCGFAPSGCIAPGGRSNVQDLFSDLVSAGVWDDIDFISGHIYNDNPTKADTCIDSLRSSARDATSGQDEEKPIHITEWNFGEENRSKLAVAAVRYGIHFWKKEIEHALFFQLQNNHLSSDGGYGLYLHSDKEQNGAHGLWMLGKFINTDDGRIRSKRVAVSSTHLPDCPSLDIIAAKTANWRHSGSLAVLVANDAPTDCNLSLGLHDSLSNVNSIISHELDDTMTYFPETTESHSVRSSGDDLAVFTVNVASKSARLILVDFDEFQISINQTPPPQLQPPSPVNQIGDESSGDEEPEDEVDVTEAQRPARDPGGIPPGGSPGSVRKCKPPGKRCRDSRVCCSSRCSQNGHCLKRGL